jgi:Flp pilus assembly protein CpaB
MRETLSCGSFQGGGFVAENSSSRIFLMGAVVLGVLATVMAFAFIQNSAAVDRGPKVHIVVAAHDLRANAVIDPERDLKVEEIPVKFAALANQSLDPEAKGTYKGQRINRRVLAGQPIFLADLAAGGSFELKEPYRALTIPADAGLVIPGDYVQIIVSSPEPPAVSGPAGAEGAMPPAAKTAGLNNATMVSGGKAYRVLAVGGSLSRTRSQATNADQYASSSAARMVTLEVTAQQAKEIVSEISNSAQRNMLLICPSVGGASTTGP